MCNECNECNAFRKRRSGKGIIRCMETRMVMQRIATNLVRNLGAAEAHAAEAQDDHQEWDPPWAEKLKALIKSGTPSENRLHCIALRAHTPRRIPPGNRLHCAARAHPTHPLGRKAQAWDLRRKKNVKNSAVFQNPCRLMSCHIGRADETTFAACSASTT